jgi:hypothetical protein
MAKQPAPAQPENTLEREANDRLHEAQQRKNVRVVDYKEAYFFAAPDRQRQISSQSQPSTTPMFDAPELNTDLAFQLCADFTTEVINTYLPEAQNWCERKAGEGVSEDAFSAVADEVRAADKKIFEAIRASNFYSEIAKAFNPDLAIAGTGLFIDRPRPGQPIQVLAVPMREMEINLGPDGENDDRFIVKYTRNSYVQKLVGPGAWAKVGAELKAKIAAKPAERTEVRWGWWRLWEDVSDEVWQHVIMIGEKLIDSAVLKGEGCCAFLVMRFNPSADWPWAIGPMIQGLPTLRQVDEWERQIPEAVERATNPAIKYPDDGVTNVEQGLEAGKGYPTRPGSGPDFGPIYQQPSIDPAIVDMDRKEHRLKKTFYCDHPEQTGDTPPTLGQWLDELARMQRRIGTAGYSFWREGPMRIFLRFKYLLEVAGTIKAVADKSGRMVSTQPYNPTQRAAEQQEIATAVQCAQIMGQMFPEEFKLWIDGKLTMQAFIAKMRTSGLLKMRNPEEVENALGQIKQLVMGRQRPGEPSAPSAAPTQGAGAPAAI